MGVVGINARACHVFIECKNLIIDSNYNNYYSY